MFVNIFNLLIFSSQEEKLLIAATKMTEVDIKVYIVLFPPFFDFCFQSKHVLYFEENSSIIVFFLSWTGLCGCSVHRKVS